MAFNAPIFLAWILLLPALACTGEVHEPIAPQTAHHPPLEVLRADLERSELAVEVELASVEVLELLTDDGGRTGYVQYQVTGRVTGAFKGDVRPDDTVSYRCTLEHDPGVGPLLQPGRRYVVFLRTDPATGHRWPVAENAQHPSTPSLLRLLGTH